MIHIGKFTGKTSFRSLGKAKNVAARNTAFHQKLVRTVHSAAEENVGVEDVDFDKAKADEIVKASRHLKDFQKFPGIGEKTAMKLVDKLKADKITGYQSLEDFIEALGYNEKKIETFRQKLGVWLKTIDNDNSFRTVYSAAEENVKDADQVLDETKADEIVQASRNMEDFKKFPGVGEKTAMKLFNKLKADKITNYRSLDDLIESLGYSDKKIESFRQQLVHWLKIVDITSDGIEVLKKSKKSNEEGKQLSDKEIEKFIVERSDWKSVFSYCFDNHNFSYVILDSNCQILHHGNEPWSIEDDILDEGLTTNAKILNLDLCRRIVDEATQNLPQIDVNSTYFICEHSLSMIGEKSKKLTTKFLSTYFLFSGLIYSKLMSKFVPPYNPNLERFHEIQRRLVYKHFQIRGRDRSGASLEHRISIDEKIIENKIFPKVDLKPYELPIQNCDEKVQTLLAAWIQALLFVRINKGGRPSANVQEILASEVSPKNEEFPPLAKESSTVKNANELSSESNEEILHHLPFRANLDGNNAQEKQA